jgi:hypothetical protein
VRERLVDVVLAHGVLHIGRLLRLAPGAVQLVDLDCDLAQPLEIKSLCARPPSILLGTPTAHVSAHRSSFPGCFRPLHGAGRPRGLSCGHFSMCRNDVLVKK